MERPSDLIVLLKSRAASKYFRKPKLSYSSFHVTNLALGWRGSLDPLRGLAANTADHVRMSKRLRGTLLGFDVQSRWNGLGDSRMKGRGATGDDQVGVSLITRAGASLAVAGARTVERRMGIERRRHVCWVNGRVRDFRVKCRCVVVRRRR